MTETQDEINAEPSEVCIFIIIRVSADEAVISVATIMIISKITQIRYFSTQCLILLNVYLFTYKYY